MMNATLPKPLDDAIENADSDAKMACREYFIAIGNGELTMQQALELVADMNSHLQYADLMAETIRGMLHGYLTRVQAAQWMLWALQIQSQPVHVQCRNVRRRPALADGDTTPYRRCPWSGELPPGGMCPMCGARLPDLIAEAEAHLAAMQTLEQEATT